MTEHKGREDEPLQRIHIFMYERDISDIKAIIGKQSDMSKLIRNIVRNYLDKMREKAKQRQQDRAQLAENPTKTDGATDAS